MVFSANASANAIEFYAETSFMCGCGYFGVRLHLQKYCLYLQLSSDRRLWMVGICSYQQQQQCQQCNLICRGLNNFSAKGMSDVVSYPNYI